MTATPRPTESPLVSSTAVARPRQGSIELQLFACLGSIETFDPANCGQAVDGYDVQLVTEDGDIISLEDASFDSDGAITWENLPSAPISSSSRNCCLAPQPTTSRSW